MERELYTIIKLDLKIGKINKKYILSKQFTSLHDKFVNLNNRNNYFYLNPDIKVKRKDQLILNIQYNNLFYGFYLYEYKEYCRCAEEFFTYFLNYEIITGICSPDFPSNIKNIFSILNKYVLE